MSIIWMSYDVIHVLDYNSITNHGIINKIMTFFHEQTVEETNVHMNVQMTVT